MAKRRRNFTAEQKVFRFRRNWSFPQDVLAINKGGGKHHVEEEKEFHA